MTRPNVLLVDDDRALAELLTIRLGSSGFNAIAEDDPSHVLEHLGRGGIDVVLLDLRIGEVSGLDVLAQIRAHGWTVPVIMLTAHGTIESAVEAMRRGAYGFLSKPFLDHELLQALAHAVESVSLRREVAGLRRMVQGPSDARLVGTSAAIARVRDLVARVGSTDATVLITGESGTGKELAARSLHAHSTRAGRPFVGVNCGALPADLLESALFGHVRGAFTGATSDREGLFGAAEGGTLFLDEIGEASLAVQVKLLRVLEERRYTRVGSTKEIDADVRIVAATNRDLSAEVAAKRFREDLFYRLHVVPVMLPALRDRPEDIPLLAEVFLERAAVRHAVPVPVLGRDAVQAILRHSWPGNARELSNVMEAALLLCDGKVVEARHLSFAGVASQETSEGRVAEDLAFTDRISTRVFADPSAPLPSLREAREAFDRAYLLEVLRRAGGNVTAAARLARRNRSDFYDILQRHGLSRIQTRDDVFKRARLAQDD